MLFLIDFADSVTHGNESDYTNAIFFTILETSFISESTDSKTK